MHASNEPLRIREGFTATKLPTVAAQAQGKTPVPPPVWRDRRVAAKRHFWWRCRESNSGLRTVRRDVYAACPDAPFRSTCAQEHGLPAQDSRRHRLSAAGPSSQRPRSRFRLGTLGLRYGSDLREGWATLLERRSRMRCRSHLVRSAVGRSPTPALRSLLVVFRIDAFHPRDGDQTILMV